MTLLVQTVLGPIDVSELGVILPHEHLAIDEHRVLSHHVDFVLDDVELACREVEKFKVAGGSTIVDVTTPDLGRDVKTQIEVARRTNVNVVMATGRYLEPYFEAAIWTRSTRSLASEFVRELEVGVDGVRAGVIGEIGANQEYVTPAEERVHRAAAAAQADTGAPIMTHSALSDVGIEQLAILADAGADLRRVAVGHADTFMDPEYHEAILSTGAFLEIDTIHGSFDWETQKQLDLVVRLVKAGHLERVLLSQDVCARSHLTAYGGSGYAYLVERFVPMLRERGFAQEQTDMLVMMNPARFLAAA